VQPGGQSRQRMQQKIVALLLHETSDRNDHYWLVRPVTGRPCGWWRREARQIEPVIDQIQPVGMCRQAAQMLGAQRGAGDSEISARKLVALLPFRRFPYVLGVGGKSPGNATHEARIERHRRWRVHEMSIEKTEVGRGFAGKHGGLSKTPY